MILFGVPIQPMDMAWRHDVPQHEATAMLCGFTLEQLDSTHVVPHA